MFKVLGLGLWPRSAYSRINTVVSSWVAQQSNHLENNKFRLLSGEKPTGYFVSIDYSC